MGFWNIPSILGPLFGKATPYRRYCYRAIMDAFKIGADARQSGSQRNAALICGGGTPEILPLP
jgi:hypothetical protein